jgi:hypothetical protein
MNLNRLLKSCFCVLAACAALVGGESRGQTTLARWTFETSVPTTGGPLAPEQGTGSASSNTGGAFSNPAGWGSTESWSSNNWNDGEYFQFQTSSTNLQGITVSWQQVGSNTGPRDFELAYSTDGTNFTAASPGYAVVLSNWNATLTPIEHQYSYNLSTVPALNNQATLYFRLRMVGTVSVGGGVVASGGTSRVDNFTIVASAPFGPPPVIGPIVGSPEVFTTTYGVASAVQTFSVSGTDLTAPIVATAPAGFEVSSDSGTTWGATASFAPSSGSVTGTLSVRLKANAPVLGVYDSAVIALTSTGATAVNLTTPSTGNSVAAAGLAIAANPVTKSVGVELGEVNPGSTAFVPTGLVNGELVGSVTITYGAGRLAADLAQVYTGSVVPSAATGGTFTASNYSISYTAADLTVTASPTVTLGGTFTAMTAEYGTASVAQSFTVSGGALTADVVVGAPVGFEVSDAPAGTYGASVTLTQTGGAVASTTLYLRMKGNNPFGAVATGDVTATSTGATTVTLAVPAGSVSQKVLTITGLAGVNKFYDKTLAATIAGTAVLNGVVSGDEADVTLDGTGATAAFGQFGQGTGLPVTVTGFVLGGTKAGNYALTQPTLVADIQRKELTLTDAAVTTRAFNGGVVATVTGTLTGVISPDVVTFPGWGRF